MNPQRELQRQGQALLDSFERGDVMTEVWMDRRTGARRVIEWAKLSEHTVPAASETGARPEAGGKTRR